MSGNTPFYTLHQGGQAPPAQASQGQGNPVPINQASGYGGAVPRSMPNQQLPQSQQQQHFQRMYPQYQQPYQAGESRHTADRRRGARVSATSDLRQDCMTEADMREHLSEYIVYHLVKGTVEHDVDHEGNPALPTWANVNREELPLQKYEATRNVRRLGDQGTVQEKLAKLKQEPRRQVDGLLAELERVEEDSRYCYLIAQLNQEIGKIPYEQYLRDRRNWDGFSEEDWKRLGQLSEVDKNRKKKAAHNFKVKAPKDKDGKSETKKETKSITVYYRRTPRPDVDVVAMYETVNKAGRAIQLRERVERPHQQNHSDLPIHHQEMHYGLQQPSQYQQSQNFQQPQYSQQYPQRPQQQQQYPQQQPQHPQYPQQQYHNVPQQAQQQPRPAQQAQIPIPPIPPNPPKAPLPAVPRDQGKPIVIPQGSAQKLKGEPVKVINASPAAKNKPREKRYPVHSPRSSRSSIYSEDDIFSVDSETTRSSMPSDAFVDKRGRTKGRGKGRRDRSESTDWSRSRSRGRDRSRRRPTHKPELYGVRQHTVGGYSGYGSPPLGGVRQNAPPPPPPPPSTERDSFSPDALKTIYNLGKMEGQKQASGKGINEPVSPRIIDARPVMRDSEEDFDGVFVGEKVYRRRAYDSHHGSGVRPAEKVYYQPQPRPRASGNQFRQPPAQAYDREYPSAPSDDYSDGYDHQYTHTPAPQSRPQPRPQSPDRRGFEQPFRRTQHPEAPYMSGGLRDRAEIGKENPFKPMPYR